MYAANLFSVQFKMLVGSSLLFTKVIKNPSIPKEPTHVVRARPMVNHPFSGTAAISPCLLWRRVSHAPLVCVFMQLPIHLLVCEPRGIGVGPCLSRLSGIDEGRRARDQPLAEHPQRRT